MKKLVTILQKKISKKHDDSFWYDGLIAETAHFEMHALGEIRILSSKSQFQCNGFKTWDETNKWESNLIDPNKANDGDLEKIGMNWKDNYYWDNNNWFEVMTKPHLDMGYVCYSYDEALKQLKAEEKECLKSLAKRKGRAKPHKKSRKK